VKEAIMFIVLVAAVIGTLYIIVPSPTYTSTEQIVPFTSASDFTNYLEESEALFGTSSYSYYTFGTSGFRSLMGVSSETGLLTPSVFDESSYEPERVSETNVQVQGIDEPDIVKTDGSEIYYSTQGYRNYWWEWDYYYSYYPSGETKSIKAFPPENITEQSGIEDNGDLLLYNDTLVVISYNALKGYDVSNPESPELSWVIELNSSITTARLYNGKIYLITRSRVNSHTPCPMPLMSVNGALLEIACSRIYHPVNPTQIDQTYNVVTIDAVSGGVEDTVSFVGSTGSTTVYMSNNAIYITYPIYQDTFTIYYNMVTEKFTDLLPATYLSRIQKLNTYEISTQAKMTEIQIILAEYTSSLDPNSEEYRDFTEKSVNRTAEYFSEHKRDFVRTGVVKVGLDMQVLGSVSFPGTLLNQFSLDEYDSHLRVATTVTGMSSWSWSEWANDVYIFDSNLNQVGSVIDLGLEERLYAVRFLGDKGYLVTFRQIDPFFVLDLSNPANPQVKGELKIPGYSSYLHPIGDDKVLGIGEEDWKVKLSLFDVSSPENPTELSKYQLDDYWSEVGTNHHAFLLDSQHQIFFLPAGSSGYVFSYANDTISLIKQVSDISADRAIYIDDYLYIIGDYKIVVLDENTWEEVSSLTLVNYTYVS
jgi:uncharacterized secreted protein with C-terminal beta-propeller domain